jgi:predicted lipid-binding transport protein (Tim44 family)
LQGLIDEEISMNTLKSAICAAAVAFAIPALAEDAHHPPGAAQSQSAPAQQSPGQPARPGMAPGSAGMPNMMGQMMGGPGMSGMMQMMHGGAHIEGRLAFIKAELKITAEQEKAWSDFASALRQVAARSGSGHGAMRGISGEAGSATPPQMLEQYEKHLTERLEAVRTVRTAVTPFYAVLSDEQKKTFAQLHPMFVGMM